MWDKALGRAEFTIEADGAGAMPFEEAASLLALRCLIRGRQPGDFELLVGSREPGAFQRVFDRALTLLKTCQPASPAGPLSRRETEVLTGLVNDLSNKEIAGRLNISESTVKFHVSNLLAKFGVSRRSELMRAAYLSRATWQPTEFALQDAADRAAAEPNGRLTEHHSHRATDREDRVN